jgi:hypothetical protein
VQVGTLQAGVVARGRGGELSSSACPLLLALIHLRVRGRGLGGNCREAAVLDVKGDTIGASSPAGPNRFILSSSSSLSPQGGLEEPPECVDIAVICELQPKSRDDGSKR